MADIYDTEYLAGLSDKNYEEAMKVQWPWAADQIDFTRASDRNVDEFGRADSVDRLMTEINNGRMYDVDKSIGDDFKDGKISYPIIISWENSKTEEKNFWKRVIVEQKQTASDFSKAKALINKHQGIKKTYELASLHAEKAIHALSIFENSIIKESLIEVANVSLSRLN